MNILPFIRLATKQCSALCLALVTSAGITAAQDVTPTPSTSPGIESVCKSIRPVKRGSFIYKNSAPLRSGGTGTALVGYRREPTLICYVRLCSRSTKIYDSLGHKIGFCPWASAEGASGGRFRCSMKTAGLRKRAVNNAKDPSVFFKLTDGSCAKVPDAGKCYGSVKGLCNQLIK